MSLHKSLVVNKLFALSSKLAKLQCSLPRPVLLLRRKVVWVDIWEIVPCFSLPSVGGADSY